jgi:hypothetical protein
MGALRQPGPEEEIDEFCIQQNSALVEEASAAVESLSDQTAQLTEALSLEQQLGILVLMLLTSKGAATVSQLAERHLYLERFPAMATNDAALADGKLLPEDSCDAMSHPTGVKL